MSETTILETLRGVEFFHDIGDEHLARLANISRPVEFPAQTTIFREHDKAKDLYVITEGQVSLVICAPKVGCRELMQVSQGDIVGWSPLVGRAHLSDTARTLVATKALAIDGEKALELFEQDPKFGYQVMHRIAMALSERLNATRLQLLKLSGRNLPDIQIESD